MGTVYRNPCRHKTQTPKAEGGLKGRRRGFNLSNAVVLYFTLCCCLTLSW